AGCFVLETSSAHEDVAADSDRAAEMVAPGPVAGAYFLDLRPVVCLLKHIGSARSGILAGCSNYNGVYANPDRASELIARRLIAGDQFLYLPPVVGPALIAFECVCRART